MTSDYISAFAQLGAATLGESGGRPMSPRVRAAWRGARVSAPAFPVICAAGDNLAIHVAVAEAPPGSVLVVSVGIEAERGYWGEVLTTGAEARGIAGLVIDGGVRDVSALEAHGFPVFSTLIALRGATKEHAGRVGGSSIVGDIQVEQDDWIVADADGVTVVPHTKLDDVLAAGRAREAKEAHFFEELRAGRTTIELLALDTAPITRD
ncbi:MAG TPA: dimethylmenaquinone methyltransferase [Acidimicrobiia bacterium]|jgi:4-hydroxy-4-methyl-2-oxoglutarate aldolase|nr:dimethylmenaquinone methyltransferase [Acidimicrobiia bacterium]